MLKILINAYACCPGMGSEPGMAWNWTSHLAKHCELHIITESEFRDKIEAELSAAIEKGKGCYMSREQAERMHFHFIPVGKDEEESLKIRKRCWNQGDWRFYFSYAKWQEKALERAREIVAEQGNVSAKGGIDVLHQLNMIGFREPGRLYKLSEETGIPLVWGPTNAKEGFPTAYLSGAPLKSKLFILLKNLITRQQLSWAKHVRKMASASSFVIAASTDSGEGIRKYLKRDYVLLNESGCDVKDIQCVSKPKKTTFDLLWVGRFIFTKQLGMALKVIKKLNDKDVRLHIVGGSAEEETPYKNMADALGIAENVVWHQKVSHDEVQLLMQQSDLFFFTSIAEGTPHVILEAFSNKLPVLCFNTCGHGDCVNEKVGIKIPLTNPQQSIADFAEQISYLKANPEFLSVMANNCPARQQELSWDRKAEQMVELYEEAIRKG